MSAQRTALAGLDGATPLGFLAALGLLAILREESAGQGLEPRLSWAEAGGWRPVFSALASVERACSAVAADAAKWDDSPILRFRYLKTTKTGTAEFGGLTPPVAVLRAWLNDRLATEDYVSVGYACALMSETATQEVDDKKAASAELYAASGIRIGSEARLDEACMQTPFDFSSRNIQFLNQIDTIRRLVVERTEWIRPALTTGEPVGEDVRSMGWDITAKAPGAQYATRSVARFPVAEWLAFRGLAFLPVFGASNKLAATGCGGKRLDGEFVWPVWTPEATLATIRSLVSQALVEVSADAGRARGIAQVFRAGFSKLGKYDAIFTPPEPVGGQLLDNPLDTAPLLPERSGASPAVRKVSGSERFGEATKRDPDDSGRMDWSFDDDEP